MKEPLSEDECLQIGEAIMQEAADDAGTEIAWSGNKNLPEGVVGLTGGAVLVRSATRVALVRAPFGRTRQELTIVAHEAGHVTLGHYLIDADSEGLDEREREADEWAAKVLLRHGVLTLPEAACGDAPAFLPAPPHHAEKKDCVAFSVCP